MFRWNDRFNLCIDYEVIEFLSELEKPTLTTDDLHYCLLAMICGNAISNPYAPYVFTTFDNLLATVTQDMNFKITPKVKEGLKNGFNTLRKYGIIKMSENFIMDKKQDKKQMVYMDLKDLEHIPTRKEIDERGKEKEIAVEYVQLGRNELAIIMKESNTPHHLIAIVINYCSRFRIAGYTAFEQWRPNMGLYNVKVSDYKGLSTWVSQDTAKSTWANRFGNDIERKREWEVTQAMFSRYCNELVTLKIFDRLIINENGRNLSYYFRPQHRDCVEWAIKMNAKQKDYMEKQEESKEVVKSSVDDELDQQLARYSGTTVDYD